MNARQRAFVDAYLVTHNASEAARQAGYAPKRADAIGYDLLRNTEVAAAIAARQAEQAARLSITADRVQQARARLAFADPRRLFGENGQPLAPNELDADTAAAVAGIDLNPDGSVKRYRLETKAPHLAALAKFFKLDEGRIGFPLPAVEEVAGCASAQAAITAAVARGELLASEGAALSALVENQRRGLETTVLEQRIAAIEERLGK